MFIQIAFAVNTHFCGIKLNPLTTKLIMQKNKIWFAAIALIGFLQSSGMAQVITPVSASASTFYSAQQDPINLINGSGLVPNSGNILTNTHNAHGSADGMWHSSGGNPATEWVIFDLGAQYRLTAADIWQMNQPGNLGRGVMTFGIFTSPNTTDPVTNYVGSFTLNPAGGVNGEPVQQFNFSASGVRRVMLAVSNSISMAGTEYVGLAEVRFQGSEMITPVAAAASTFYSGAQDPINLINGNGLVVGANIFASTHNADGSGGGMWHSSGGNPATEWLIFDLGAQCKLSGVDIWQMNQPGNLGRGVKTFGLFTSPNTTDPVTNYVGSFTLNPAGGANGETAQLFNFTANNVRRVMLAVSNSISMAGTEYVGLSEVRFEGSLPLAFAAQPKSATNYVWGVHTFSATAVGTPPPTYQWYRDGSPASVIPGATNNTYTIDPVTNSSAGGYFVVASSGPNVATSMVATLTVLDPTPDYSTEMVAYYTFDQTSGMSVADSSGNNASATLFNFPVDDSMWVTGRVGGAIEFNATDLSNDDQMLTDGALNLANGDFFTFAFWAKRRSDNNPFNPRIVGPVDVAGNDGQYWVLWQPGVGVGFYPPAASPEPIRNVWQHFVVTYDRVAGKYETYVDGRKKAEATSLAYLKTSPVGVQWAIGCKELLNAPSTFLDPWRGFLDDVRIYNRILLPGDVKALYEVAGSEAPSIATQPKSVNLFVGESLQLFADVDGTPPIAFQWFKNGTPLPDATNPTFAVSNVQVGNAGNYFLVASNALLTITSAVAQVTVTVRTSVTNALAGYWKFDEVSGSVATDSSGLGNEGAVNSPLMDGGQWVPGQVGNALYFRGNGVGNDWVIVPNWPKATNGTMTVSAWVTPDPGFDTTLEGIAYGGAGSDGTGQFALRQPAGGGVTASVKTSSFGVTGVSESTLLPTDAWVNVVMVADGANLIVYRNGNRIASAAYDGTLLSVTNALTIGARAIAGDTDADNYWQGKIDEVAYWTRGLSKFEAYALYAAGTAGQSVTAADSYMTGPGSPTLTVTPSGGNIVISWPAEVRGFILEVAPTLPSATWTAVPGVVNNSVTITPEAGNQFYRLRW
jgi:hypothetical protein